MTKFEFMILALGAQAYVYKTWILHCFSFTRISDQAVPYQLFADASNGQYYFVDPETEQPTYLTDSDTQKPPFGLRERITLEPGQIPNVREKVETSYGELIFNMVALVFPLGNKIAFVPGEFDVKRVEQEIARRLTTDKQYQTKDSFVADDPIYVEEYLNFIDCALSLEGLSQLCVPSATRKTMTSDPKIREVRDQMLEKYKDRLDDPAVVAHIEKTLTDMDREWLKGDLGEGFFNKAKLIDVCRKKAHLMYGYEEGFGIEQATIGRSLNEEWDLDQLPAMVNALREGVHARGVMTAQGGAAKKYMDRVLQNTSVKEQDCGVQLGWSRTVFQDMVGFYYVGSDGSAVELTIDEIKRLKGQVVTLRSPQFCKTPGNNFCQKCVGRPNSENETALATHVSELTSQIQGLSMQKAHGKALKAVSYDPTECLV